MKIAAIIQVRMGSIRLPGKTLSDIAGQSLLSYVIDPVRALQRINAVVITTTTGREDDELEALAQAIGARFTAAVLDRYYQAATRVQCDMVGRITADE